jgi:hypothetical protein
MSDSESVRPDNPNCEYTRRLSERRQQLVGIRARHRRLWTYLMIVLLAGLATAYATLSLHLISPLLILLPAVVVLALMRSSTKNARIHSRVQRIVEFFELGLERLAHQWQGRGKGGKEYRPDNHPYARDLDLFGTGSLFEFLCTARTSVGREMLANWLLSPADVSVVTERHLAVAELRDCLDFREDWASVVGEGLDRISTSPVRDWVGAPAITFSPYERALSIALPIVFLALLALAKVGIFGHSWPWVTVVAIALEVSLAGLLLKRTRLTAANLISPSYELSLLVPLFDRLEKGDFRCSLLRSLQSQLIVSSGRPSREIRTLNVWVWLLGLRQSEYFALPSALLLWGTNLAILIEHWRQRNREGLGRWLDSLGQFEALLCLARYYYENPDHTFPIVTAKSSASLEAEALGHPLLDRNTCVKCDLQLHALGIQLAMVSGSNMSGKSTLLRSVGVNSVLAFAGAPVRATRFHISTLQIACSIAIQDSLLQGKSRFQVEVERLKQILVLSKSNSLLFLLDEVLSGTNSSDRFWGARAVIEQLVASGAVGLVTTHDLALTQVVNTLDKRAMNVHFEERYEEGEMRFDYIMRPGVLSRSNGLNVMAALGLLSSDE